MSKRDVVLSIEEWKSNLKARIRAEKLTDTELESIAKACLAVVEGDGGSGLTADEHIELNSMGKL